MKATYAFSLILSLLAATGFAQSGSVQSGSVQSGPGRNGDLLKADASVIGVWRAQMDGLPWVTLTLTDEGGTLSGAILFYLHIREPGGRVTSTPGVPEPLLNPHFDGRVLTFKVSHRHAHPPGSLSSAPVEFRLELPSDGHGSLVNDTQPGPAATLERSDY
jgi:hypothetical protein